MKKKLIIIVSIIIIILGGYLIYRAVSGEDQGDATILEVIRGEVIENVSVTGTVIPAKQIDLQFESSGKINSISIKVGDQVTVGQILIKLNAGELSAQLQSAQAALDIAQAKLNQTLSGSRLEDIQVYQSAVDKAKIDVINKEQALIDAQSNVDNDLNEAYEDALDVLKTSYTKADQALLIVFAGMRETYFNGSGSLATNVKDKENRAKEDLSLAKTYLDTAEANSSHDNVDLALPKMGSALRSIRDGLAYLRAAMDDPSVDSFVTIAHETSVETERTSIDTQLTNLTTAEQDISSTKVTNQININNAQADLDDSEAALQKAQDELALKKAGPRQGDIDLAEATVKQAQADVLQIQEKINKTILRSPVGGTITNIDKEVGEVAEANKVIVSMISTGNFQIEANISETEIAKINLADQVKMTLDALGPDEEFTGQVIKINPAETVVSGVIYYKINSIFDLEDERIKSGMTVNLDIETDRQENVLYLPYYAIKEVDSHKYVMVIKDGNLEERTIKTGLEGENMIEIIEGLSEGERVIIKR
ncbi:efflux RND transporter periplasmic adaptor subunit [Patescibacteria group bacterium]|nr:efflux RND transporter periplasmic adaptor subunit [Patescibacteria group bacterium]